MGNFLRKKLKRLAPLLALALVMLIIGPDRLLQLHGWQRWILLASFLAALITPVLVAARYGVVPPPTTNAASWVGYARIFWKAMLVFNGFAFLLGVAGVIMFLNVVPLRYTIIAPCINLLLVAVVWKVLDPRQAA